MAWYHESGSDLRFAARSLGRRPWFAALAILTLALGIGATTTLFGVVKQVLLTPLPYGNPQDIAVVWVIMNNFAYGTIAGLEKAHYGTTYGRVFEKDGKPYSPDYAAIAKAYGVDGVKIRAAAEFRPALERAIASKRPVVIDVEMQNEPVPTAGHWNIMDIYSPGAKVHHAATGVVAAD